MLSAHDVRPRLLELLAYDQDTGWFTRRKTMSLNGGRQKAGSRADSICASRGYASVVLDGNRYLAHRLAWLYVHGVWPDGQIDHVNGVRSDNRLCNLREATQAENNQNRRKANSSSGLLGVSFHRGMKQWAANINVDGQQYLVGYFDDPADAGDAYQIVKAVVHPFSPAAMGVL